MTTVQIVGIVVATAIVVLLISALLVTRRRGAASDDPAASHASFLDGAPQDTFSGLGKAEQPMEDVTMDPGAQRQSASAVAIDEAAIPLTARSEERENDALGLDWGPSSDSLAADEAPADDEITGELTAAALTPAAEESRSPILESGASADGPVPAQPAEGGPAASEEAAPESGPGARRVPLSDIIVTTSNKMVDLQDPEVRRMLTDLVKYEIDQATHCRQQGQTIDAVLQLTEAEKISRALGMRESAAAIRTMMEDLQSQT
jgi:hypothetical protein